MKALLLALLAATMPALAADDDAAALSLADTTTAPTAQSRDWRVSTEGAWSESALRGAGRRQGKRAK